MEILIGLKQFLGVSEEFKRRRFNWGFRGCRRKEGLQNDLRGFRHSRKISGPFQKVIWSFMGFNIFKISVKGFKISVQGRFQGFNGNFRRIRTH